MTSSRSIIPGLSIYPVDDEKGEGIQIPTLTDSINIPQSQRYGNGRIITEFEKLRTIPCGLSQIVYECKDKRSGDIRVLKKFKMPYMEGFPKSSVRELGLLKAFVHHDNIIRSYGVAVGKSLQSNYLILESWICSLEDLMEYNIDGIYHEAVVKGNMKQLLIGVGYVHECLIIHRNITCENIVFTAQGVLKITGFPTSRFFTRGDMTPGITDLRYRAPELLLRAKRYTAAVDMWSVGCLLARLVLKDFLFKGSSELEILNAIHKVLGSPTDMIWAEFSQLFSGMDETEKCSLFTEEIPYSFMKDVFRDQSLSLQDLLQELLVYNPKGRPSAYMCLNLSYFKEEPRACSPKVMTAILSNFISQRNSADETSADMASSMLNLRVEGRNKTGQ